MDKKDIKIFLDDIYERGTGSWNTIQNKKVRCNSFWDATFTIDNQKFDYDDAVDYLYLKLN